MSCRLHLPDHSPIPQTQSSCSLPTDLRRSSHTPLRPKHFPVPHGAFCKEVTRRYAEQIVSIRHIKAKVCVSRSPSCPTPSLEKQCAFLALFDRLDVVEVDVWHFESYRYIRHVNREREHATLIAVMAGIHQTASVVVHFLRDV